MFRSINTVLTTKFLFQKSDSVMMEAMDHQEQTIMHYAAKLGNVAVCQVWSNVVNEVKLP